MLLLPGWDASPPQDNQHEVTKSIITCTTPPGLDADPSQDTKHEITRRLTTSPGWDASPSQDTQPTNLRPGASQLTIFNFDDPLVAISYLSASDCGKGSEHGMESLERAFIRKCNAYSILLTKQGNFTQQ